MGQAIPGLDNARTTHKRLLAWVREIAELTQPDRVHWCDGSDAEWEALTGELVAARLMTCGNEAVVVAATVRPSVTWPFAPAL